MCYLDLGLRESFDLGRFVVQKRFLFVLIPIHCAKPATGRFSFRVRTTENKAGGGSEPEKTVCARYLQQGKSPSYTCRHGPRREKMTTREKSMTTALVGTFEAMLLLPNLPSHHPPDQLATAAESASPGGFPWARPTIEKILELPWNQDDWQEGATAPGTKAVSHLLVALSTTMLPESPVPDIAPMWDGGICAEWHRNGVDLELYVASDGNITWSFEDQRNGEEQEEESAQPAWLLPESKFREHIINLGPADVPNRV